MKKCSDCEVEMIEDVKLYGQHPFELGIDGESELYVSFINGKRVVKGLFGKEKEKSNHYDCRLKARICPECGKVELYINQE